MSSYSVQALRDKFSRLSGSQESIETLSLWIIHHKSDAATTVSVWFEDIKSSLTDLDHLLLLLYVANDVLQNGRRRGAEVFHELFREPLKEVFKLVRATSLRPNVMRMIRVWRERKVYSGSFISELTTAMNEKDGPGSATMATISTATDSQMDPGFSYKALESVVSAMEKLESELAIRSSNVQNLKVDVTDPSVLTRLKDKSEGGRFGQEIRHIAHKLDDYCDSLVLDVQKRVDLVELLIDCRLANARRLPACRQLLKDYDELSKKADSIHKQLEGRVSELQRAHSTAATDLSQAKSDIKEVGDMELDSSEEEDNDTTTVSATAPVVDKDVGTAAQQASQPASLAPSQPSAMGQTLSPAMPPIPVSPMMGPQQPPSLFASPLPHLPMSLPTMGFQLPHMPLPPMQAPHMQVPPMQGPPMQAPPMQAPPMQAPPMQAPPMQAPPMQAPPMQAYPMQAPPMPFPPTPTPLPPKAEVLQPKSQQHANSEHPTSTQGEEMAEKKTATLDERVSNILKKQTEFHGNLWKPQDNNQKDQKQAMPQGSTAEGRGASPPEQTASASVASKQAKPAVTFDTNALKALLGVHQIKSPQLTSSSHPPASSVTEEQPKSDDITLKVGNALVNTVSTQESLKKVLELWMKRDGDNIKKAEAEEEMMHDTEPSDHPLSPSHRPTGHRRPSYDDIPPHAPPPFHERGPPPRGRPWDWDRSPPPPFSPHGRPRHSFPPEEGPLPPRGRPWMDRPPHPLPYRERPARPDQWLRARPPPECTGRPGSPHSLVPPHPFNRGRDEEFNQPYTSNREFPADGRVPPGIPHRSGSQEEWPARSPSQVDPGLEKPYDRGAEWSEEAFEPDELSQELPDRMAMMQDPPENSPREHHWQASHHEGAVMNQAEYNGEDDTGWNYSEEAGYDSHDPPETEQQSYEGEGGEGVEINPQDYRHHEFSRRTPPPSWHPVQSHPEDYSEDTLPPNWHPHPLPPGDRPHWGREQPHWRPAPPPGRSPPPSYGHPHPPMRRSPSMDVHRGHPPRGFERRPPPPPWFAGGKRSPGWLPPPPPKRAPL